MLFIVFCTILIKKYIFIHYILTALHNLLGKVAGKLVNCLVFLHHVLCTVALTITTLGKIKCIFCTVIVNK